MYVIKLRQVINDTKINLSFFRDVAIGAHSTYFDTNEDAEYAIEYYLGSKDFSALTWSISFYIWCTRRWIAIEIDNEYLDKDK